MVNCDMLVAVIGKGSTVTLQDYWSTSNNKPRTDEQLGGVNSLKYISGGLDANGHINVTFSRLLVTGDPYDQDIIPDLLSHICWAYRSRGNWDKHDTYSN